MNHLLLVSHGLLSAGFSKDWVACFFLSLPISFTAIKLGKTLWRSAWESSTTGSSNIEPSNASMKNEGGKRRLE